MDTAQQPTPPTPNQSVNTSSHPFWQHISKRTLMLILVLLFVTASLLYLAIRQEKPSKTATLIPTPTVSPAHATLALVQSAASTSAYQTINVVVDSNQNQLSGAQLSISYDPKILTNVAIKPGTYFTNATTLFNTIDKTNGRISYVLAITPTAKQATGSGTIATISYTIAPTTATTTTVSFLPKTTLTQEGIIVSVLKSMTNLTIQIPTSVQTPASSSAK